jgi:HSP20 family protein
MPLPTVLDQIDRLFDELIRRPWGGPTRSVQPAELREVEDGWVIEIPAQGLRASDFHVHVEGRRLTVEGHRRQQERRRHAAEWSEVSLYRTVTLPADADPDRIDATVNASHLTIHVRRRQP